MKQFKLVLGMLALLTGNLNAAAIHLAARLGSITLVQRQLNKGVSASLADDNGNTPLHYTSSAKVAQYLLRSGADPNVKNNDGLTPLHLLPLKASIQMQIDRVAWVFYSFIGGVLASAGSLATRRKVERPKEASGYIIGEILLINGGDPNATDSGGNTPLHDAVRFGRLGLVTRLLKHGANPNIKNNEGRTPLHAAIGLIDTPIKRNITLGLTTAAATGSVTYLSSRIAAMHTGLAMRERLNSAADFLRYQKGKLAEWSAKASPELKGDAEFARKNVYDGTYDDVMRVGQKAGPLKGKELEALKKAAANQADDAGGLAYFKVILSEDEAIMHEKNIQEYRTLEVKIKENMSRRRLVPKVALVVAVALASIILLIITVNIVIRNHIVQKLIDSGADVNALDNLGNTPLHFLAAGKKFKLKERKLGIIAAHKLLDAGANPNAKNKAGLTPYQIARRNYRLFLAAVLKPSAAAKRQKRRTWFKGKVGQVKESLVQ